MEEDFEQYAELVDAEAEKLYIENITEQTLGSLGGREKRIISGEATFYKYMHYLEGALGYLGAKHIEKKLYGKRMVALKFDFIPSAFFRKGALAKGENIMINETLRGVVGAGFDEEYKTHPEYEADLFIFYIQEGNSNQQPVSEKNVVSPREWRKALSEFFDHPSLLDK
jgi:hypothetical protein